MAKLPGYLKCESLERENSGLVLTVKIRFWHPLLWMDLIRSLFSK